MINHVFEIEFNLNKRMGTSCFHWIITSITKMG